MLSSGKIPPQFLEPLLRLLPMAERRVITGPAIGEDTAVIDNGDSFLLVTSDPITFVGDNIGWYAVTVNVNDIAVMGGTPRWFCPVILLPEGTADMTAVEDLFAEIGGACSEYGVAVVGGHTEITPGLEHTVICGNMIGEAAKDELVDKSSIRPGDVIYLAGGIAVEAVSIIARERSGLLQKHFSALFAAEARNYIKDPGICVLEAAQRARGACSLTGMHDPTEGGLLGGLWELAERAGCGFFIDAGAVPVLPHCRELCGLLNLDPLRLIASGALLITLRREHAPRLEAAFSRGKSLLTRLGRMTPRSAGMRVKTNGKTVTIQQPIVDEINKLWE